MVAPVEHESSDELEELHDEIDPNTNYLPFLHRLAAEKRKRTDPHLAALLEAQRTVLGRRRMRERIEAELDGARISPATLRAATELLLAQTERAARRIARQTAANFRREQEALLAERRLVELSRLRVSAEHVPKGR